jgi:hypothetical protein
VERGIVSTLASTLQCKVDLAKLLLCNAKYLSKEKVMLKMLGLGGGPGARLAIGVVLVAIGLARHGLPLLVVGGVVIIAGLVAWVGRS